MTSGGRTGYVVWCEKLDMLFGVKKSIRESLREININVDISVLMAVLKFGVFRHL